MSTLVLALAAGMALGSGPEAVSAEMEQPLDLSGEWEGAWQGTCIGGTGRTLRWTNRVEMSGHYLTRWQGFDAIGARSRWTDAGPGRVRLVWGWSEDAWWCIFRQDGDRVWVALRPAGRGWPTSFDIGGDQELLTLRRVRPGR